MRALDTDWAVAWTRATAAVVAEHRAELSGLDREIGDGDHGENLDRGFRAVLAKLDAGVPEDAGRRAEAGCDDPDLDRRRRVRAAARHRLPAGGAGRG